MLKNSLSVTYLRSVSYNFELGQDLEAAQPAMSVTDANSEKNRVASSRQQNADFFLA